jgi:hypothetical protein
MWVRAGWSTAMSPGIRARLQAADASFFNLETPVDPTRPVPHRVFETLHYNAPPAYLDGWVTDAPCFASICNNHAISLFFMPTSNQQPLSSPFSVRGRNSRLSCLHIDACLR